MNWLLTPDSANAYVPSAVYVLWSGLFIVMYYYFKKSNSSLLPWGIALGIFSLQPVIFIIAQNSILLAYVLFWLIQSMGSTFLIAGLFEVRKNKRMRKIALLRYLLLSALVLSLLAFNLSKTIWLSGIYALQSLLVAGRAIQHVYCERKNRSVPIYVAFFIFSATSAYYAIELLTTGKIDGYDTCAMLNALTLCNTISSSILAQTAINANTAKMRLASLVENTSQGLAFLGGKEELLQANHRMFEILGTENLIKGDKMPAIDQLGLDTILSSCDPAKKSSEIVVDFEKLKSQGLNTGRQGIVKLSVSVREIQDVEDAQRGTFIQIDDITETRNTLNELIEKRYRMDLMFKSAGACEYSKEGRTLRSASWFKALGYNYTSIDILDFQTLIHPQDRYKYPDEKVLGLALLGDTFSAEARVRNSDGIYVWYFISSCNEQIDDRLMTLGMAVNIDMNKRMESYAMQNDRLAAVGQLANGVVHDINNYLMTIQTSLGMIDATSDENQKKKFASYMQEALANSSGMLKRLVSFSKGDEEEYVPVLMNSMLGTSKELLQRSLHKGVKLQFTCNSLRDVILGNYYELQNIILNIGLNARDALPEIGGEIAINTWNSNNNPLKPGNCDWYCISIRDNGCGMSDEVQKRIFDPFFTTKPHGKGSGLGLFTAYGYIQHHGGTISVESILGTGTEFVLAFPLAESGDRDFTEKTE